MDIKKIGVYFDSDCYQIDDSEFKSFIEWSITELENKFTTYSLFVHNNYYSPPVNCYVQNADSEEEKEEIINFFENLFNRWCCL